MSAFVFDADGTQLSGRGSLRCYAIADRAADFPHVGVTIADALWKAGYGRIEFGKAGQALVRCPIDTAVWQPNGSTSPGLRFSRLGSRGRNSRRM